MNRHVRIMGIALAAVLAAARFSTAEEPLSWEDCRQLALAANPELAAQQQAVRSAEARIGADAGDLWPQLNGDLSVGWSGDDTASLSRHWDAGLTLRQLLFDGLRSWKSVEQAGVEWSAARALYGVRSAAVRRQLRESFVALLLAQASIDLNTNIQQQRQKNHDLIRLRYEGGREHRGSLLLAQAQLEQAKANRRQADRDLTLAQYGLQRQAGRTGFAALAARGDLADLPDPSAPDFEALVNRHVRVAADAANVESARLAKEIAESDYFPTLAASASLGRSGPDWLPGDPSLSAGVSLSWSLFTGGRRLAQAAAAQAAWVQAQATLRDTRETVRFLLVSAWNALERARDEVMVRQQFLAAAEERSRIARAEYTTGLINFDNWTIIEDDLVSAKQIALTAQAQAQNAAAAWVEAYGGGMENE